MKDLFFENSFTKEFPGSPDSPTLSRQTPGLSYVTVPPTPVAKPEVLAWSMEAGALLGLDPPSAVDGEEAQIFSGNRVLPAMEPFASRYGGHQFGQWAGQLGDGRAISLGEARGKDSNWEVQLKGAGLTPYSRRGDGRAVLRSSLREFLCSEAMFHLGVPTTRALCCVTTGEEVVRDMFYDGHPEKEPGAITTRMAPTFLRFGHFEILARTGEKELLRKLTDYTVKKFYPGHLSGTDEGLRAWFSEICERTSSLMVDWLRVGFVHGVMNTDNMSILGLTIDYGPYGWLDVYDPDWTPNTTDAEHGRYRFGTQPSIALWNLARLAEALGPLVKSPEIFVPSLEKFRGEFAGKYQAMMGKKLGLDRGEEEDQALVQALDELLRLTEVDPTIFYRQLARHLEDRGDFWESLRPAFYAEEISAEIKTKWDLWVKSYLGRANPFARASMDKANPYFLVRNYLVQEALDELRVGNRKKLDGLMAAMKTPYEENEFTRPFFARRPEWARSRPGCSALSCSS